MNRNCPTCGEEPKWSCKCFRSDSGCKNGHTWHYCFAHSVVVMGQSDHSIPTETCTCLPKDSIELTLERSVEVLRDIAIQNQQFALSDHCWLVTDCANKLAGQRNAAQSAKEARSAVNEWLQAEAALSQYRNKS